jgi:TATA-box binding protein (TBP) (component of TFIID and TFIIIB)
MDYNNELIFPEFNTIKVSTKTFIVMTNLHINIKSLFNYLPITDFVLIPKRRGRKKKCEIVDPNKDIISGSIITLEFENEDIRGVDLKKKKNLKSKKRGSYFRNAVTVVMIIDNKKINFKISCNGHFQITGCKNTAHAATCVKYIWGYIENSTDIYTLKDNELIVTFIPAMRNIDFNIGFNIDREKLDEYINTKTPYNSLLETSFGYTGVNIKFPIENDINTLQLKQIKFINNQWVDGFVVPFQYYLDTLKDKERAKKIKKERFNTFLVFHSGKAILSGINAEFQIKSYLSFLNIIIDCYSIIKEDIIYIEKKKKIKKII